MHIREISSRIMSSIFILLTVYALFVFLSGCFVAGGNKNFLEVSGRIEGREHNAGTKVNGRVDEVYVKEGDEVKSGDPIAIIYLRQINAMIDAAESRLNEAAANLKLAEIEYERYGRLLKENAIAKMEYDYVENRYIRTKQEIISAGKEVDKLKVDLDDTKVISPIDGTVITKVVRPGEVVSAGTPIVTIIDMNDLYLKVFLTTEFAGKVSLGDEARIYPDALSGEEFDAVVDRIGEKAEFTPKNVETKSQRSKLVFEIKLKVADNKLRRLKPGMPCDAVIKLNKNIPWSSFRRR